MKDNLILLLVVSSVSCFVASSAFANEDDHDHDHDHDHGGEEEAHSDVEFYFHDGKIGFEEPGDHLYVFETDFLEGLVPFETDDPGFNNDEFLMPGYTPVEGSLLGYNVWGPLKYWNGFKFVDPGTAYISIEDTAGHTSDISGSTVSDLADFMAGSLENIIGEASSTGEIHQHIDFTLKDGLHNGAGAYGLMMAMTTDEEGIEDSHKFGLFFNVGLDHELFEEGVDQFNEYFKNPHPVPVPAAVWLFGSALLGMVGYSRRKASV
ncbi:MAG: hypothetical protein AAF372_04300 [Pseudomonadota bacterium]